MEIDLNDYTVINEGEAEILMHKKNQVFFNKAHVFFFPLLPIGFDLCKGSSFLLITNWIT